MKVQSDSFEKTQLYFLNLIKKPIKNRFTELRRDNNDVVRLHKTEHKTVEEKEFLYRGN